MPPRKIHIARGEHAVSDCPDTVIVTLLGSCVSACLWDPVLRIGGMNHILLPDSATGDLQSRSQGTNAMELLINALLRRGADRRRLQARLFGGARMIAGLSDIGRANAMFVSAFCEREGFPCLQRSFGGTSGRRLEFCPADGTARQSYLADLEETPEPFRRPPPQPHGAEIELF